MTTNYQDGHRLRLRDRFLADNGKSMPDYEVLELLLSVALPRRDVKPLAKDLIAKFGSFSGVISASVEELVQVKGIKETTASVLKVVDVASHRASWQRLSDNKKDVISNWFELLDHCRRSLENKTLENFVVYYLNSKGQMVAEEVISEGTIDSVHVYPREIVAKVLANKAKGVVLAHNHPSGDCQPSDLDVKMTKEISLALKSISVRVWDHIIVAKDEYFSFKEAGLTNCF